MSDSDFPSIIPPPPGSQDPVTPENTRKKRDWWNVWVGVACAIIAVLFVGALIYGAMTDETKEYPGRGSASPTAEAPSQATLDAATVSIVQALDTEDEAVLQGTVRDIQQATGCLAVTGGRVIVDPTDKAEVAEEASKRAQFVDSLEAQGLRVGHHEFTTPEGQVHQVIGFECH